MPTILITGAASGLGAALTTHYLTQPSTTIHAIDRHPLPTSLTTHPNLHAHTLDLTSEPAILTLATHLSTTPLDLLLHCAGIRGLEPHTLPPPTSPAPPTTAPYESLHATTLPTLTTTLLTNALSPFILIRALLPSLLLPSPTRPAHTHPKAILLSSRLSSLTLNAGPNPSAGGAYAYRASKTALNALVRSLAADVPEVVFGLVHPGRVETGLVGWREEGALGVGEVVGELVGLVEGWGPEGSGGLVDRGGRVIPW